MEKRKEKLQEKEEKEEGKGKGEGESGIKENGKTWKAAGSGKMKEKNTAPQKEEAVFKTNI